MAFGARRRLSAWRRCALSALFVTVPVWAQDGRRLHGEVRDPLGALVAGAKVELVQKEQVVTTTTSGPDGGFALALPASGRYRVRVSAPEFQTATTASSYFNGEGNAAIEVTLATATLTQEVTVTTTGTPVPEAQTGAAVTVLPSEQFALDTQVQEPLRLVPGLQLVQSGETGGTTSLFIRGGSSDANKVLIDGVPANAIGGAVEFANFTTVGVSSIEVLREPNSALYGSDALAGVVSVTTARGTTPLPLFTYAGDAGNFGTYRNNVEASTAYRHFDLYSAFGVAETRNNLPNSVYHNATYAGNFGWKPNAANEFRFTVRRLAQAEGQPDALAFYGIPNAAKQSEQDDFYSAAWNGQTTARWHNQIRYGGLREHPEYHSFGATGILDPVTGYYDGAPITLTGANGYSVSGQAVFQFSNAASTYLSPSSRDFVYAQTDFHVTPHLVALGGFKFEAERGSTGDVGSTPTAIARGNYSYTVQLAGDVRNRLFYNLGTGLEDNGLFGFAATPRASLAYYLVRPSAARFLSGTKLHGTFGKGIKEPGIYQQANSLYGTLLQQPNGAALLAQYKVGPIGPENSRTFDGGVDQELFDGRMRLGVTYFHNQFTNDVEYVPPAGLIELGVPAASLLAPQYIGAYLNSGAFRAQGVEFESEYKVGSHLFARGGYTYTDAEVQRSFSSDNVPGGQSFNTSSNFATIPIGAYTPLVGARPFRIAPHTGYFGLTYTRPKLYGSLTGTLVGRRDDSDFLSDTSFGNTLLLPNRNLDGAYQRLELGGGYQVTPRLNVYANLENLLSEHYFEAFGYPALPLTFRTGLKVNFGGESWRLK